MTNETPPTELATRFEVCSLPVGHREWGHFAVTVEWRDVDRWAVTCGRDCLGRDGTWSFEVRPSEREDEWLAEHRFDFDTAMEMARTEAPKATVNGFTIADVLNWSS